ncbi:MAG: hypothetical protein V3T72_04325 [Thermoanaerobaculia bacterium]
MRVVNLSRRPFVNRRPMLRITVLLWIVGAVFLAVNVRLYTGHWLGSAENRRLLAEVRQKLSRQQEVLAEKSQKFHRISLDRRNRRAAFLNQLIDARTFPWSALFDDLEEVLPPGVRLVSVQPTVRFSSNRRSRARAERVRAASASPAAGELAEDEVAQDEVDLRLHAVAQSFDQLPVFVARLYDSPHFLDPYLSTDTLDPNQGVGATVFNLSTVYLTRREPLPEPPAAEPDLAAAGAEDPTASETLQAGPRQAGPRQAGPRQAGPPSSGLRQAGPGEVERQVGPRADGEQQMAAGDPERRLAAPDSSPPPDRSATGLSRTGRPGRDTPPAAGTARTGRSARPDTRPGLSRPGLSRPGLSRPGFVGLPASPPPAPESQRSPPPRPTRRDTSPPGVPPERPSRQRPPPGDRPADNPSTGDDSPAPKAPDASGTPAILQQPRQLGSIPPAEPWGRGRPASGLGGGAVA